MKLVAIDTLTIIARFLQSSQLICLNCEAPLPL